LKALYRKSDILVLDEPSAVLTPQETEELFEIIRGLAKGGTSVIFITHKLNEVIAVADKITVLRRGAVAGETTPKKATAAKLAEMMVGREVQLTVSRSKSKVAKPLLEVAGLRVLNDAAKLVVSDVTFAVRSGEILAVAGVQGLIQQPHKTRQGLHPRGPGLHRRIAAEVRVDVVLCLVAADLQLLGQAE
jgi:simple sugar transport system ATP-binding protein